MSLARNPANRVHQHQGPDLVKLEDTFCRRFSVIQRVPLAKLQAQLGLPSEKLPLAAFCRVSDNGVFVPCEGISKLSHSTLLKPPRYQTSRLVAAICRAVKKSSSIPRDTSRLFLDDRVSRTARI
ncbi:hypothetical protein [Bradyrhizobium sp. STM 3561]|uniref:hypothetical protein n=1 Tax=Bradyrhizobium sp. STM 3561 TaxID=578923 RepID=UPI00388E510A